MDLHECFLPLHDPTHVIARHIEVHSLEPRVPHLHENQAPSQGTITRLSPHQILYPVSQQSSYCLENEVDSFGEY